MADKHDNPFDFLDADSERVESARAEADVPQPRGESKKVVMAVSVRPETRDALRMAAAARTVKSGERTSASALADRILSRWLFEHGY